MFRNLMDFQPKIIEGHLDLENSNEVIAIGVGMSEVDGLKISIGSLEQTMHMLMAASQGRDHAQDP